MTRLNEPFFWSFDDLDRRADNRTVVVDADQYPRLWAGAPEGTLKGEATTGYLRSAVAIPAILQHRPDARFILMLRNPAEMAASFHAHLLQMLQEDVPDFERAWRLQDARSRGRHLPRAMINPAKLQYARVCALGDQLERVMALVPDENLLVLFFDQLCAEPRALYLRTLEFLGVADDGRVSFERVNANQVRRGRRLSRLHRELPRRLGPLYAPLRALVRRLGISPSEIVTRMTLREAGRPPLAPAFEAELVRAFLPQVEKLEVLFGCNLDHWKRPRMSDRAGPQGSQAGVGDAAFPPAAVRARTRN
jgi:hypothetical protein